jgi:hypothetical protein
MRRLNTSFRILEVVTVIFLAALIMGSGKQPTNNLVERVRAFTRNDEFNFINWTMNALGNKLRQASIGTENYLSEEQRKQIVIEYLKLVWQIQIGEAQLSQIYADPTIADAAAASIDLSAQLEKLRSERDQQAPLAEAILQAQISETASQLGLTLGGQTIPPVMYHVTPLPWAMIISPRDTIRQEASISLSPDITIEEHSELEDQVDQSENVSSLIVGVGGLGLYPTMVAQTSDLTWLSEVVAHEWVHNYLTLRPLGINYLSSPELRIMNETTASIAGKEIGEAVLKMYYPELVPEPITAQPEGESTAPPEPPEFDYYREMRETRVTADQLLAEGKIEEAEQYMEQRQVVFWEHGYQIRKLNQAYFAFYGAYADHPGGGAAGSNPVGEAVQALRERSGSLAEFINRISWISSFEQLQKVVQASN